jgi:hypothetical protein
MTIPEPNECQSCRQPIALSTERSRRGSRWESLRSNPFLCLAAPSFEHAPGVA